MTLNQWLKQNGNPYTEQRGNRIAVCTDGLLISQASKLWDLKSHKVWAVCGPFVELVPTN